MRKVISHILTKLGFDNIKVAEDGRQAYRMVVKGDFDFVISDWNMPNMTGIQLLKALRKTEKTAKIPVLLVTAEQQREQIMEAAKAGVNSFIVKPFSPAELEKKITLIFPKLKLANQMS